mgnify:CR=1 FL=1
MKPFGFLLFGEGLTKSQGWEQKRFVKISYHMIWPKPIRARGMGNGDGTVPIEFRSKFTVAACYGYIRSSHMDPVQFKRYLGRHPTLN